MESEDLMSSDEEQLDNSYDDRSYSDVISSDLEADLYGLLHHESDLLTSKNCSSVQKDISHQIDVQTTTNQDTDLNYLKASSVNYTEKWVQKQSVNCTENNIKHPSLIIISDSSSDASHSDQDIQSLVQKEILTTYVCANSDSDDSVIWCNEEIKNDVSINCEIVTSDDSSSSVQLLEERFCNPNLRQEKKPDKNITNLCLTRSGVFWCNEEINNDVSINCDIVTSDDCSSSGQLLEERFCNPISRQKRKPDKNVTNLCLTSRSGVSDSWQRDAEENYRPRSYRKGSQYKISGNTARFSIVEKVIKCYICGGNHLASHCEKRMCGKCSKMGHGTKQCRARDVARCSLCEMEGHWKNKCPDTWRRYHLTTTSSGIVKGPPPNNDASIYCYNCGSHGHFGATCRTKMNAHDFPTWPSVIHYQESSQQTSCHPSRKERKKAALKRKLQNSFTEANFPRTPQK